MPDLIQLTNDGLYCAAGNFHIDPWRQVETALITHGHGDHARRVGERFVAHEQSLPILRQRLGDVAMRGVGYGEAIEIGDVQVSFHSAGHILGSAQIRVDDGHEVWVASGDYKRAADPTCEPFEPVQCDTFITEATFALPVYRWRPAAHVVTDIYHWWQGNAAEQRPSVVFCYSLGKIQRVLAHLTEHTDETIWLHGAAVNLVQVYRDAGVHLVPTRPVSEAETDHDWSKCLIMGPPSAAGSPWMRRFKNHLTGFCSGWMRVRGNRRRRGYDRGFVLSDHADWPALLKTIRETRATRVLATHRKTDTIVRYMTEKGLNAQPLRTEYGDPEDDG